METMNRTKEFDRLAFTVLAYRGFCAEDEYIAVGDEKATGEGGAYQESHTGLLRHFAYREPRSRSERCR